MKFFTRFHLRHLVVVSALFLTLNGIAWSQAANHPDLSLTNFNKLYKEIALTPAELDALDGQLLDSLKAIQNGNDALEMAKTQMTQTLIKTGVTIKDLEPIVRSTVEAEYVVRIAKLDRQLKIRALLGDRRWVLLARLGRIANQAEKAGEVLPQNTDPLYLRTLNTLRNLGGSAFQ
jgi:hypothetical protein